jgi:GNAT superfamily N-acetyltransferase
VGWLSVGQARGRKLPAMRLGEHGDAGGVAVVVCQARREDGRMLQRIDAVTYSRDVGPAPAPRLDGEFFDDQTGPEHVLVAEVEDVSVGYVKVGPRYRRLSSAQHVHQIWGLAVAPEFQRHGVWDGSWSRRLRTRRVAVERVG